MAMSIKVEVEAQIRATSSETATTELAHRPGGTDDTATASVRRQLSRDQRRAIGQRVIEKRQRMLALLEAYDNQL